MKILNSKKNTRIEHTCRIMYSAVTVRECVSKENTEEAKKK